MKKHALCLLAVLLALTFLLGGCGSNAVSGGQNAGGRNDGGTNSGASPVPQQSSAPAGDAGSGNDGSSQGWVSDVVYVPSFEAYPASMDPGYTRCAMEREDGVWFIRQVEEGDTLTYCLMRGGKDASDPELIASFDADTGIEWMCFLEEGKVWLDKFDTSNWANTLLEVDLETGEILREYPFPAEHGLILDLFDLPDRSLGISSYSMMSGEQLVFKMDDEGNFIQLDMPVDKERRYLVTFLGSEGSGLPEGECLAVDKAALFAFTPGSGDRRELMRWEEWGIYFGDTTPLGLQDGVVRLLDRYYKEYITLTPTPRSEVPPRQEVSLACLTVESALHDAVRDFNRRSIEYYVDIRDYSEGKVFTGAVKDQAITAMNLDIIGGNLPDLIAVQDGVPFRSYAAKGILQDLGPWLADEGIELVPQLRRAGTLEDELLMVCGSFGILTAAGMGEGLAAAGGWTLAEAEAMAAAAPDCAGVFTTPMTRDLYMEWLNWYLEGFLDREAGTASFDSPEFRDMLRYAAALPTEAPATAQEEREIMEGRALVDATTISSVQDWQSRDLYYEGQLQCPGFPVADGVGSIIKMEVPLALSASAANPEGACAFLRSMLEESRQAGYTDRFPANQAAFARQLAEAMREPTPEEGYTVTVHYATGLELGDGKVYIWDSADGERAPRAIHQWIDENYVTVREAMLYAMSEEQKGRLTALLDSAVRTSAYDQVVAVIVSEEVAPFFAGQRDLDTVVANIQSRVALYMAEQG